MRAKFLLPILLLLVGCNGINIAVNSPAKDPIQFTEKDYVIRFSKEKSGWQTTEKFKKEKERIDIIRSVTVQDLQKRYDENNCRKLTDSELGQEEKYLLERNCLFQNIDNFVEQKEALKRGQRSFIIETNSQGFAGSNTMSEFVEINDIPYYVHTENSDGDCGWWRVFETFIDNKKWSFYVEAGQDKSCSLDGARENYQNEVKEVDSFFKNISVAIERI